MLALLAKIMSYLRGLRRGFGWSTQPIIVTPPAPIALRPLSISNGAFSENAAAGTPIGDFGGLMPGSSLSLVDSGGGKVAVSGLSLVVGSVNTDFETTPSFLVTVRESLSGATNSPRDTVFIIGVINLNDTSPSAFAFTDVTNVSVSTTQTSDTITVVGLGASDSASAVVSGDASSLVSKNGGSFVAGPITVVNGDTVRVRHTSSGSTAATVNTTLTIGSTSDTFSSTTSATPALQVLALFNSTYAENTAAGTVIGAILNTTAGSALSLTDNAGNKVAISGTNLTVGATNSNYETVGASFTCEVTETLGGATGSPKATTLTLTLTNLNDTNPSAFTFTDATGVTVTSTQTSNTITVAGLGASDSATATLSGAATSQLSLNGGAWQAGPVTVVNGDTLQVRHTSSASASTAVNTTLTIGTTSDTFSSTTASPGAMDAPVLTQTSVAGTNPPQWDSDIAGYVSWDGSSNGDKQLMRWRRVNGGAWATEAEQGLDDELLTGGFTWPLLEAAKTSGYLAGGYFEAQEQRVRYVSGVETVRSAWSNAIVDNLGAPPVNLWTPETPPAAQNIAFASTSATFAGINFGAGLGIVCVASSDRSISGVTVGGSAATLVSQNASGGRYASIWKINIASGGSKSVVATGSATLKHIAIATGTIVTANQTETAVATPKNYAFTSDPQALSSITVPAGGIALCALVSENVTATVIWGTGTQDANVVEGVNSNGVRLTTAHLAATGAFSLTGLSTQGSAMVAAAWGP